MGDFFGDSKRHLPELVALRIKKNLLEQKRSLFACLFSKGKGENYSWISLSALPLTQTVFCSLQVKLFSTKQNVIHITVFLVSATILIVEIIFVKVFWKPIFLFCRFFGWSVVFSEHYSGIIQNVFIFHIRSVAYSILALPCPFKQQNFRFWILNPFCWLVFA